MSLGLVRGYYRTKMEALDFHEWPDAFNSENIPSTVLDRAFHLDSGLISNVAIHNETNDVTLEVIVRFFIRGFSDPIEALDNAHTEANSIIESVLATADRTSEAGFKNILFTTGSFEPLSDTNDNSVIGLLGFENLVMLCI